MDRLRALTRSAVGGWIAGILLAVVDLLLVFTRFPVKPYPHDRAVLVLYSFVSFPLAGFLLGAIRGLPSAIRRRPAPGGELERAFFFVSSLFLVAYGSAYLVFRIGNSSILTASSILLLAALLGGLGLLARRIRVSGRQLPSRFSYGVLTIWILAIGAASLLARPRGALRAVPPGRDNLVLFITVDTLRADALGIYGNARARTPNIDALAREGALFLHAQAAASWTLPSHASMFTGLTVVQHGANGTTLRLPETIPTVTEALRDNGYQTAGFVSSMFVNSLFGFGRGFSVFDDATFAPWHKLAIPSLLRKLRRFFPFFDKPFDRKPGETTRRARKAGETTRRALQFLDKKGPKFLWIHLFDPHTDYNPPAEFRASPSVAVRPPFDGKVAPLLAVNQGRLAPPSPAEISALRWLYDGEVSYVDSEIGRILEEIKRRGLADRTSILLTSDHGEAFGEHRWFLHRSLHQEILHVPFILWAPGRIPAGLRVPDVVRGIDVAATLADLAGVDWKTAPDAGRSVLPCLRGAGEPPREARSDRDEISNSPADRIVESSLLVWPWKLYVHLETGVELFNLADDPGETKDRAREQPELVRSMRKALAADGTFSPPGARRKLDPETTRDLKSLGYLQ